FGAVDYLPRLMPAAPPLGPGISFMRIGDEFSHQFTEENDAAGGTTRYIKPTPVSGIVPLDIEANVRAERIATGVNNGIARYEVLVDGQRLYERQLGHASVHPPAFQHFGSAVGESWHDATSVWDSRTACNGQHELFVRAFDVDGTTSFYDAFLSHSTMGEYLPVIVTTDNPGQVACN
ncbi:MAG: hypothetical protein AAF512_26675, partial [Pseudomonadota bacterium]